MNWHDSLMLKEVVCERIMTHMIKKIAVLGVLALILVAAGEGLGYAASGRIVDIKVRADQFLKQRQVAEAIPLYKRVLREDRQFANAYYNLAVAYYVSGDLKQAAENLESFVTLRPEDAEGHYNLASLKLRMGQFGEAEKSFRKADQCPSCPSSLSRRIKKALHYMKDLHEESPEAKKLIAYLLSGSTQGLFAS